MLNDYKCIGNLTKRPELKHTTTGKCLTTLSVAINSGFGDNSETLFIDADVWEKVAQACVDNLDKGSRVFVSGRLKQDSWLDKENNKRYKMKIIADKVIFLSISKET